MKKNLKKIIPILAIIFVLFPSFVLLSAQPTDSTEPRDYTVLVPLPGTTKCTTPSDDPAKCTTTLSQYLPAAFNLAVGIAVALAFIYITIGGVMYATSDALSGKSQGRDYITNALIGLLLVIGSYVILWTINPKILDITIGIGKKVASTTDTPIVVSGGCTGCVALTGLPMEGGVQPQISSALLPLLKTLEEKLTAVSVPWVITETYSYDPIHVSTSCHHSGSCVDAKPLVRSRANIMAFYKEASTIGFSTVVYEVPTSGERESLVNGCSKCSPPIAGLGDLSWIKVNTKASGQHFHIVK